MPNDDERQAPPEPNPDDEVTDLSLAAVPAVALHLDSERPLINDPRLPPEPPEDSDAAGLPFAPLPPSEAATPLELPRLQDEESPWRFNALGAVLLTALICTLTVALALLFKLNHTRGALIDLQNATEAEAIAEARRPPPPEHTAVEPAAAKKPAPQGDPDDLEPPPDPLRNAKAPAGETLKNNGREQLLLLLTVGKEPYARKQLALLKEHCAAPLTVYRQKRGRCAWDECFVVAASASQAASARGCGQGSGHTLRDKEDFELP